MESPERRTREIAMVEQAVRSVSWQILKTPTEEELMKTNPATRYGGSRSAPKFLGLLVGVPLALATALTTTARAQEILPFPPKPSGSVAGRTMQESVYSPLPAERHLPKDSPNIIIVLIDDVGPGQSSTFGGEIATPTMDRIAREGIAYNSFHTTAMCSPTRASLLTGRNHHYVGNGQIAELANHIFRRIGDPIPWFQIFALSKHAPNTRHPV